MAEQSPPPNITVEMVDIAIVVKVGDVVHVWIEDRRKLLGVQSWRMENQNRYFIEYTLEGGVITSDYDSQAKWKAVLSGLAKVL